jgi:hypothetical protein
MKKVYVAVAAAMMLAGSATAQVNFGIEGGWNFNNLADKYEDETNSNMFKHGFHAGVIGDIGLSNNFSVVPGLRYSMKGGEMDLEYNSTKMVGNNSVPTVIKDKNKLTYHYVEMPVNVVYKTGMPGDGRFMIGAGPYLAYMVNAQNKWNRTESWLGENGQPLSNSEKGAQKLETGSKSEDDIKSWDYGAQAFVGYQLPGGMFFKGGSQFGFANTIPKGSSTFYQKNYNFFVTVGYMLGGRQ